MGFDIVIVDLDAVRCDQSTAVNKGWQPAKPRAGCRAYEVVGTGERLNCVQNVGCLSGWLRHKTEGAGVGCPTRKEKTIRTTAPVQVLLRTAVHSSNCTDTISGER